ncbi:MAG: AraC family transcriptional regulator [Synechococcus sp.]|nr:AraC family transcriptional regulator [Synechococcus sp.]
MAHRCDMDQYLGVVIRVPQQRLRRSAQAMAGSRPRDPGLPLELLKPQGIDALTPRSQILLRNLCSSLDMLASSSGITSHEWAWLGLDDHIVRLLLLLLNPALQKDSPTSEYHLDGAATKRRLDPLLDWIQAHLKCPLSLSELEARSGYSRRSLQLLFRHHLGCTPSQWVRHRRLEAVHGRLLHPEETDTVGSVALEYGFSSASSFTREFHKCFGQLPSELLRQSRGRL